MSLLMFNFVSQTACEISAVLSEKLIFCTAQDALEHAMAAVQHKSEFFNSQSFSSSVLKDVSSILTTVGSSGCLLAVHALTDLHRLARKGRYQLKRRKTGSNKCSCYCYKQKVIQNDMKGCVAMLYVYEVHSTDRLVFLF